MTIDAPRFSTAALNKFLPAIEIAPSGHVSAERRQGPRLALFVPSINQDYQDYYSLIGRVLPRVPSDSFIDEAERSYPDMRQIIMGNYVDTIDIPKDLVGNLPSAYFMTPLGLQLFRNGKSINGRDFTRVSTGTNHIAIYAREFPEITQEQKELSFARYTAIRAGLDAGESVNINIARQDAASAEDLMTMGKILRLTLGQHPSIEERLYRFGRFDARLLYPHLQTVNPRSLNFDQLQKLYPDRIAALQEGYVTFGQFHLDSLPERLVEDTDMIVPGRPVEQGNIFLPSLISLYNVHLLQQTGFAIRLVESEVPPGFADTDRPMTNAFAVMVKPKEETSP